MAIVLNLLMPPEPIEEGEALKVADSGDHDAEGDDEVEAAEV